MKKTSEYFFRSTFGSYREDQITPAEEAEVKKTVNQGFKENRCFAFTVDPGVIDKLRHSIPLSSLHEEMVRIKNDMIEETVAGNSSLRNRFANNARFSNLLISVVTLVHRAVAELPPEGPAGRRFVVFRENRGQTGFLSSQSGTLVFTHVGQGPEWKEIPSIYLSLKLFAAVDFSLLRGETDCFEAFKILLMQEERAIETGYSHVERVEDDQLRLLGKLIDEVVRVSLATETHILEPITVKPPKKFTAGDREKLAESLDARLPGDVLSFDYRMNMEAMDTLERRARRYRKTGDLPSLREVLRLLVAAAGHDVHDVRNRANYLIEQILAPTEFDAPLASRFFNMKLGEELELRFSLPAARSRFVLRIYECSPSGPLPTDKDLHYLELPLGLNRETGDFTCRFRPKRLGHFDFLVFKRKKTGDEWMEDTGCSGRINVLPDIRGEIVLEIFPDIHGHTRLYWQDPDGHAGLVYNENGEVIRTGTFDDITAHLEDMKSRYMITAIYLLGVQRRGDNREDWAPEARSASPFAPMSLTEIEPSLGGEEAFRRLVKKAHELGIKIIVDIIPHLNRKSAEVPDEWVVRTYDDVGNLVQRASTDGRFGSWNDGKLLNYRKLEIWDWLVNSVLTLIDAYDIDGIRFDSAHAVPVMMKRNNFPEIYGTPRSSEDMLEGSIILNDRVDNHYMTTGYYDSACSEYIANPFHYYLSLAIERKLREKKKDFFIHLAECFWGREQFLSRSGVVPYNSALFKICEHILHGKADVRQIYHLYHSYYPSVLPPGTELVGILGNHDERRALNTFGARGIRAAVGLTSFMNNLLLDYEGSAEGEGWKVYLDNIYVNWNQFEAAANRGVADFYQKLYAFHRENRGRGYLLETDNHMVAASLKQTDRMIWVGAFNFSDINQYARLSFADDELPIDDDTWYRFCDPAYSGVDPKYEYFTGRELRVTKFGVIIPFTDRMKLLKLEVLEDTREHYNDLLLESLIRVPGRENHESFSGTFALQEVKRHLETSEQFADFVETRVLPLFVSRPQYDVSFILKRVLYHLFRMDPAEGKRILQRVDFLAASYEDTVRGIGIALQEHFQTGAMVFIAAEAEPFSKSGGLANVVYELPKKMAAMGEKVYVITPMYRNGSPKVMEKQRKTIQRYGIAYTGTNVRFRIHDVEYTVGVHSGEVNGVTYFMLDHHEFFDGLYWGYTGREKVKKRVAFCRACAEVILTFGLKPFFVFSNEAFTGSFNGLVRSDPAYARHPDFSRTHFLFVIHNGGWQYFDAFHRFENGEDLFSMLNLTYENLDRFLDPYHPEKLNFMAAGIRFADRVLTVSPSYARQVEVASDGLEHLLHNVLGISNAIDESFYPRVQEAVRESGFLEKNLPLLYARVKEDGDLKEKLTKRFPEILSDLKGEKSLAEIKPKWKKDYLERLRNKMLLQLAYDMQVDPDKILFTMIHRITDQKGFQLLLDASQGIFKSLGYQGIIGGQVAWGDTRGEQLASGLYALTGYYRGNVSVTTDFIDVRIPLYASDVFLMPSLNEPGGISQLEALSCGCLVVARATGGLRDTVHPISDKGAGLQGNGFLFSDYSATAFYDAMNRCRRFFAEATQKRIQEAREAAKKSVFNWDKPAAQYIERLYEMKEVIRPIRS
ncbi:MAG: glycogen/starch synthase [Spirochaetales bacterium]|nr:glycogen/starch synthase [Spirochaetales bacterium]